MLGTTGAFSRQTNHEVPTKPSFFAWLRRQSFPHARTHTHAHMRAYTHTHLICKHSEATAPRDLLLAMQISLKKVLATNMLNQSLWKLCRTLLGLCSVCFYLFPPVCLLCILETYQRLQATSAQASTRKRYQLMIVFIRLYSIRFDYMRLRLNRFDYNGVTTADTLLFSVITYSTVISILNIFI